MAWRHCEQTKVVALLCELASWLVGRMLLVVLGMVAAVRRRVVCIDMAGAGGVMLHQALLRD